MNTIERLAAFCVEAGADTLSPQERDIQSRHFGDTAVAALVGAHGEEIRAMVSLYGPRAEDRLGLLAAAVRMTEVDDIHMRSCTTPSSAIVPLLLTAVRLDPASAPRFRDALRVGNDLMTWFGTAVDGPRVLYRDIWPTYLAAPIACAGAAARLFGLETRAAAHALAIALTLTAGGSGRFRQGLSPRWYMHGCAVEAGYRAALAARAGYCGDVDLLDRDWIAQTHGAALDRNLLLEGLGDRSTYAELSIKPWCSAKQAIAATDLFSELLREGLDPNDIEEIIVRAPPAYADMISVAANPGSRSTTFASVRYQLALAAYNRDALYDVCREHIVWNDKIAALMQRVRIESDDSLQSYYPARWPAALSVRTQSGLVARKSLDAPGDPARRFSDEDVSDKARRLLDPLVGTGSADEFLPAARAALEQPDLLPMLAADIDRRLP